MFARAIFGDQSKKKFNATSIVLLTSVLVTLGSVTPVGLCYSITCLDSELCFYPPRLLFASLYSNANSICTRILFFSTSYTREVTHASRKKFGNALFNLYLSNFRYVAGIPNSEPPHESRNFCALCVFIFSLFFFLHRVFFLSAEVNSASSHYKWGGEREREGRREGSECYFKSDAIPFSFFALGYT